MSSTLVRRSQANSNGGKLQQRFVGLLCALKVYKDLALARAKEMKSIAKDLAMDESAEEKKLFGSYIRAAGGVIGSVALLSGAVATGPLIPAAILAGSSIGISGQLFRWNAERSSGQKKIQLLNDVTTIFTDLDSKFSEIQKQVQILVDSTATSAKELDILLVSITDEISSPTGNIPQLQALKEIMENLKKAYEEIPDDLIEKGKNLALNVWHLIAPLAPVVLANISAHDAANCCEHAWLAACDQGKEQHYNCYNALGKVGYIAGTTVSLFTTFMSIYDIKEIQTKLETNKNLSEEQRIAAYRGMSARLYQKAVELETRINLIFGNQEF